MNAVTIAMGLGYVGGVALTCLCGAWIISKFGARIRFMELKRNLPGVLGTIGGIAALLPALFLGTVVGGNLGGAYGEVVSQSVGLGMAGVPVGLALGIALVTTVVASVGVLLGVVLGKVVNARASRTSAT